MAGNSLTTANNVLILAVSGLYDIGQQIQGFASDDAFDIENIEGAETVMGVDGFFSGGWVPKEVTQNITLQADSLSNDFFDQWHLAQQAVQELYHASGTIFLPATGLKYDCSNGIMTSYSPAPSAKKILQPRRYTIKWGRVTASVI